jgi:hypothetical protein
MMAGGIPLDPDAQAFLNAAGITDATITTAIDTLVTDLKGYGIWTKMKALYPFVGGTATTHKFNLKDPADTDAAFRLAFVGGWTHSANGIQGNGTNAYADTFITPLANLLQNSNSFGFYSRTEINGQFFDMGTYQSPWTSVACRLANMFYCANNDNAYNQVANTSSLGFFISSRTAFNDKKGYRNNIQIQSVSQSSAGLANGNIWIGALNSFGLYSPREYAFSFIGGGLNPTEAANFYTAVQSFQTTLGRQV